MGFLRVALRPARRPITPPPVWADQTLERQPHTSRGPRPRPPRILGAQAPRPRRRRPGRRLPVSPARPTPRPPTPSPRAARRPTPPSQASTSRPKQRAQPYGPRPSSHNLFFSGFPQLPNSRRLLSPRLTLQPPRSSCAAIKAHPPSTALIHWPVLTPAKHASRLPPK